MSGNGEPSFQQSDPGSALYWLSGGDGRAGFLASGEVAFGTSITLTQSWEDGRGLWFWLDAAPDDPAVFAASLAAYLGLLPPVRGPRVLWIGGANRGPALWRGRGLGMIRRGQTNSVATGTVIETGSIRVIVAAGNTVTVGAFDGGFGGWGFRLSGTPGLVFVTGNGLVNAAEGWSGLSYGDGQIGCVVWRLDLATEGDGACDLAKLGASLRFFGPNPNGDGSARMLRVDPLRQTGPLSLYCGFDPLAPLDPARTRLGLLPRNATIATPPCFATGYITARGHGVTLAPRTIASPTPPGFVLAVQPLACGGADATRDSVPRLYYLTPDGDFEVTVSNSGRALVTAQVQDGSTAPAERLLCGTSGLDYVGVPAAAGSIFSFRAGNAAFAPLPVAADQSQAGETELRPALTALGTTAWVWISDSSPVRYYAQPEDAPFYSGGTAGFLDYLEISAAILTSEEATPAFPMVGYAGLSPAQAEFARAIEARGIAPERRRQIARLTGAQWLLPAEGRGGDAQAAALSTTITPAVSPPGLAIGYAGDEVPWAWLAIGNTGTASDGLPDLRFTAIDGAFRQALLSNRLFMVLGNPALVLANGSVEYQLTPSSLGLIRALPPAKGVPIEVTDAVARAVAAALYPVYPTETAFNAMLTQAVPAITAEQSLVFQRFAGLLSPAIGDWLFRLSPRNWAAPDRVGPNCARLIFKFVGGRSLADLVADSASWSWPEASSEDGLASTAREDILAIIRTARAAVATAHAQSLASPYEPFLKVIDDPDWCGVLALSVEVPLDSLPEPLQPLAAGIDPGKFYAHHLGLSATSFSSDSGVIRFNVTSSFGLIDYQDPIDQYFSSDIAFAFRVQQLTVGFENGALSSFNSTVQLMVNRLFGAETQLFPSEHGNNIILDGVYQSERDGAGVLRETYLFAMREVGTFQLILGALHDVTVEQTRLATVRTADPAGGDTTVTSAFQLSGRLRFVEPDSFDPFCWGPLANTSDSDERDELNGSDGLLYSNYAITMSFPLSDPQAVSFTVSEAALALDSANSPARPNSLFARFPLRLTGLIATPDSKITGGADSTFDPEAAGFVSVSAPISQGRLTQPWYGLVYEVDLGTLGALAGSVGITVRLLAAWSPAGGKKGAPAIYFGVALPGIEKALGISLPLQGFLDLGFRTIQFSTYTDAEERRQYLMRLRDFGLHVLGFSFPPGHNDISLFGNPDQTSNTKLGWYAAYDNGKSDEAKRTTGSAQDGRRRIQAARPARRIAPPPADGERR
ncbi:hemagglutinin protein [Magnetospirillum fulvum]|uniref:Hemagglutinin protein n=1 Tax=Magnetospirillum fulvum TaxID=1082 RepID=A0A1H6I148_MAGFU|nr:hemagglutinin protein [Magnetospirillum fulvum]SEH40128.1 hypothetical protein SAMN04244559_02113 [Magnetospirillum fulvum]